MTLTDPTATVITKPAASVIDADLSAALAAEALLGTLVLAAYLDGLTVAVGSGWVESTDLTGAMRLFDRAGVARVADTFAVDLGTPGAEAIAERILAEVLALPFEAVHMDGASGGTVELGYDPPAGDRGHLPHGGEHWTKGVRRLFAAARTAGAASVTTTTVQEHVIGSVDLASEGDTMLPFHAEMADTASPADVDPASRNQSPPLWSIVYGENSQAGRLVMPMLQAALATSVFHPYEPGSTDRWPGITAEELHDAICLSIACAVMAGHTPMHQLRHALHEFRMVQGTNDPATVFAEHAQQALTDLHWTARFLTHGRAELPLVTDGSDWGRDWSADWGGTRETKTNPFSAFRKVSPLIHDDVAPPLLPRIQTAGDWGPDWGPDFNTGDATDETVGQAQQARAFPVPKVLHVMRRDRRTGDLCLIVCNWTGTAATMAGAFQPRLYGGTDGDFNNDWSADWDRGQAFRVDRLHGGGSDWSNDFGPDWGGTGDPDPLPMGTGLRGAMSLSCSGTEATTSAAGDVLFLGAVPARTIQAYRIQWE